VHLALLGPLPDGFRLFNLGENGMTNKQPQTVNIDGTEYEIDSLSDKAKVLIDHVADLDRKKASMMFQLDQINVGRDSFFAMLKAELTAEKVEAEEVA
jgi:hypothetical protein